MNWHRLSVQETFELLGIGRAGLSTIAAEEKMEQLGLNELETVKWIKSINNELPFKA